MTAKNVASSAWPIMGKGVGAGLGRLTQKASLEALFC